MCPLPDAYSRFVKTALESAKHELLSPGRLYRIHFSERLGSGTGAFQPNAMKVFVEKGNRGAETICASLCFWKQRQYPRSRLLASLLARLFFIITISSH